jgi:hypothetical protein
LPLGELWLLRFLPPNFCGSTARSISVSVHRQSAITGGMMTEEKLATLLQLHPDTTLRTTIATHASSIGLHNISFSPASDRLVAAQAFCPVATTSFQHHPHGIPGI